MGTPEDRNNSQKTAWSGTGGQGWVNVQGLVDQIFAPHADILTSAVADIAPRRLLDVGSGTGATTVSAALRLSNMAHCVGIDISTAMIDAAKERAHISEARAEFVCSDAQTHAFAKGEFDLIMSRFGIMFFDDPVQAFSNLRGATSNNGKLLGIAWRGPEDNPFMVVAERAAEPYFPDISKRIKDAPGQFGFANRNRVGYILDQSGWKNIEILPIDTLCTFPQSELGVYLSHLGPVGQKLQTVDGELRAEVLTSIIPAFDTYVANDEVRFNASCWLIRADNDA